MIWLLIDGVLFYLNYRNWSQNKDKFSLVFMGLWGLMAAFDLSRLF